MKFAVSAVLSASLLATASAASTPNTSSTYKIKVDAPTNPAIHETFLALKNADATSEPNALGVWSTGPVRYSYELTLSSSTSDARLYELKGGSKDSQLIVYGQREIMPLYDAPIGFNPTLKTGEGFYNDKFLFLSGLGLRHGQDYNTSDVPSGGAGTWRACRGDSEVDYQVYWYDGSSPLPIKNCQSVALELVETTPTTTASGFITGVPAPTVATSGFITGVPAPTGTGTLSPSATNNASRTSATPKQSTLPGSGSKVGIAGALIGMAFGSAALLF